jgi:hypothetical protein
MPSITQVLALATCTVMLLGCQSADSTLIGEWSCPSIDPSARVTYKADHTYKTRIDHVGNSMFTSAGAGTWRVEGDQIISHDGHGESKGYIMKISRNELQITAPDGMTRTYERIK